MTTYFVDGAVGNDGNAGTSEGAGNAWATVDKALSTVIAGDHVNIKASATYSEDAALDTAGSVGSPIIMEGYTTTVGDEGKATIAAVTTSCVLLGLLGNVANYYCWKNMIFDGGGGSGDAYDIANGDNIWFLNCEFNDAGADGFGGDNIAFFFRCIFDNNTTRAIAMDATCILIECRISNNGSSVSQVDAQNGYVFFSEFFGGINGQIALQFDGGGSAQLVLNCTFDGENTTTSTGIDFQSSSQQMPLTVINTILYDFANGALSGTDWGEAALVGYNLINSNATADYGAGIENTLGNDVTTAPAFTNEAGDDYSLGSSSPAIDAGTDAADLP